MQDVLIQIKQKPPVQPKERNSIRHANVIIAADVWQVAAAIKLTVLSNSSLDQ